MNKTKINELIENIKKLQYELETELEEKKKSFKYDIKNRKVQFEQGIVDFQKKFKSNVFIFLLHAKPLNFLTLPIIYSAIVPLVFLDLFVTFYQWTCFTIYKIPKVKRRDYFVFDRAQLQYLNIIEKFHCFYCSYGNGLLAYCVEIVGRTEQYWCPIKHARKILNAHPRYQNFLEYGDAENYNMELENIRKKFEK